jgi:hypothetical protein
MIPSIATLLHDLRANPLALALVIINLLFAGVVVYSLREISASGERRDALMTQAIERCDAK